MRPRARIHFRPGLAVAAVAAGACLAVAGTLATSRPWSWVVGGLAGFYVALLALSATAFARCLRLEKWLSWTRPERLLILAPHQDDCAISAGGAAVRNIRLGGAVRVVYLVQSEDPGEAAQRRNEAIAAWTLAGLPPAQLSHLDLLPPLYGRDPARLRSAEAELRRIIDEFRPTVIVMPMFEGGHVHHDLLCHLVARVVRPEDEFAVFEAPEYSPYLSLRWTPHRVIALCARWMLGLVSYYPAPDGIDGRTVWKVRLTREELGLKRRMLEAFASQNGASLAQTRSYPDRLVRWQPRAYRSRPFDLAGSYLANVRRLDCLLPAGWAVRLFPVQLGTVGREPDITNLDDELA